MKQGNGLVQVGSRYSVDETMWRLEAAFRGEGGCRCLPWWITAVRRRKLG